jgi:hypothetical protein
MIGPAISTTAINWSCGAAVGVGSVTSCMNGVSSIGKDLASVPVHEANMGAALVDEVKPPAITGHG